MMQTGALLGVLEQFKACYSQQVPDWLLTCLVVKTLPGAPSSSGFEVSVLKQYLQDIHRNSASRSTTPAAQYGWPCK